MMTAPKISTIRDEIRAIKAAQDEVEIAKINAHKRLSGYEKRQSIAYRLHEQKVSVSQDKDPTTGEINCYRVTFNYYPGEAEQSALVAWAKARNLSHNPQMDVGGSRWSPTWIYTFINND